MYVHVRVLYLYKIVNMSKWFKVYFLLLSNLESYILIIWIEILELVPDIAIFVLI